MDLLTPTEKKISEKEYWTKRRGQKKLDEHNVELKKKGLTPRQTTFQTEKQYLRDAIDTVASQATSQEEISERFMKKSIFCRYSRRTPTDSYQKSHILLTEQLLIFLNRQNCLFLTKLTKPRTLSFF